MEHKEANQAVISTSMCAFINYIPLHVLHQRHNEAWQSTVDMTKTEKEGKAHEG